MIKIFSFFLSRDCVRGVGFEVLHKAFEILSNIEDDELEVRVLLSFHCVLNLRMKSNIAIFETLDIV